MTYTVFAVIAVTIILAVVCCCLFSIALVTGPAVSQWIYGIAMFVFAGMFVWITTRSSIYDE
jgi:hypothetical protein